MKLGNLWGGGEGEGYFWDYFLQGNEGRRFGLRGKLGGDVSRSDVVIVKFLVDFVESSELVQFFRDMLD